MSAEARYLRVGLFVFLGIALVVGGVLILGGSNLFEDEIQLETYFEEPVTGLEVGSPLRLRGVKLGEVTSIDFVSNHYTFSSDEALRRYRSMIRVVMKAIPTDEGLGQEERLEGIEDMIGRGLRLRLSRSGITGIAFIQADFFDPNDETLEIVWEPRHTYIPSTPSAMATISSAAERIFERLEATRIEDVVDNLDRLLVTLTTKAEDIEIGAVQGEISTLVGDLRDVVAKLHRDFEVADVPGLSESARESLAQLSAVLRGAERVVDGGTYDLHVSLENLRVATENLRDLSHDLRAQPSLLLRSTAPERKSSP